VQFSDLVAGYLQRQGFVFFLILTDNFKLQFLLKFKHADILTSFRSNIRGHLSSELPFFTPYF